MRPIARGSARGIAPPPMAASAELRWLMLRAFGPAGVSWPPHEIDDRRTADVAVRLDVAARIGSRFPAGLIAGEAGAATAAVALEARDEAALQAACLRRLLEEVSGVAAELGIPLLVLKGVAYQLNRCLAPGARSTGDLDVLAPADQAQRLFDELVRRGFEQAKRWRTEFHLPVLLHPHGMVLEIHTHIGCLEVAPGTPSELAHLIAGAWTRRVASLPRSCLLPDEDALMAHLLSHFLWQHRQSPFDYPLCRMLLDCADLGWDLPRWGAFKERGYRLIERLVPWSEVEMVRRLVERLTAGDDLGTIIANPDDGSLILRRAFLGTLDPLYRHRFTGNEIVRFATGDGRVSRLLSFAARRMWRPQVELEARFGSGGGRAAQCWRRLQGIVAPVVTTLRVSLPWLVSVIRHWFPRRPQL